MTSTLPPPIQELGRPSDEVVTAMISGVVVITRRVEIYNSDGTTPFDIEDWNSRLVAGGGITIDSNRDERRMCEFTLNNHDRALNLNPTNGFFYDNILKSFWGIEYYNSDDELVQWEMQTGEFMIDRIDEDYFPNTVRVTGRDYTKKCLQSKIASSLQFASQIPVETIIQALAANAGVTKFRLPYIGIGFDEDVVFDAFSSRWEIIKKLADSIGYEVYFTSDGYLTMRPYRDPTTSPIVWTFKAGTDQGTLVDYKRSSNDSGIKNHVIVIGATTTSELGFSTTAFGEAINTDPASPTRVEKIGDRVDPYKSDYITDSLQAQAIAEARLRIAALEEYDIAFSSLVIPWIEAGDIVDIVDDEASPYVPARFLLSSYNLSYNLGAMTGNGRRVTIVGTTRTFEVS